MRAQDLNNKPGTRCTLPAALVAATPRPGDRRRPSGGRPRRRPAAKRTAWPLRVRAIRRAPRHTYRATITSRRPYKNHFYLIIRPGAGRLTCFRIRGRPRKVRRSCSRTVAFPTAGAATSGHRRATDVPVPRPSPGTRTRAPTSTRT